MYSSSYIVHSVSILFLQDLAEYARLIISFLLIPSILYTRHSFYPKVFSIVAFCFYICINANLILFHAAEDIKFLVAQVIVLVLIVGDLVNTTIESEYAERRLKRSLS
jgi:hypothetical protein